MKIQPYCRLFCAQHYCCGFTLRSVILLKINAIFRRHQKNRNLQRSWKNRCAIESHGLMVRAANKLIIHSFRSKEVNIIFIFFVHMYIFAQCQLNATDFPSKLHHRSYGMGLQTNPHECTSRIRATMVIA